MSRPISAFCVFWMLAAKRDPMPMPWCWPTTMSAMKLPRNNTVPIT